MVDFSHLSKVEFEELCYDLISAKGWTNLNWRKGSGKPTSPSDSSRDIEADKVITDIDNSTQLLRYFFEGKHFERGVPPTEIQGALAWAEAERPYCLVIIASNFLSNPCKNYIKNYKDNNKPKFEIRIWENKLLEDLLLEETNICLKWKINIQGNNYRFINKYHLTYITKPCLNTFNYLFSILDNYNFDIRDTLFEWIYLDCSISFSDDKIKKYECFKEHIKNNSDVYKDTIHVHQIISETLAWAYHMGDIAEKENRKNFLNDFIKRAEEMHGSEESKEIKGHLTKQINSSDEQFDKYYKYYNDFCENVVFDLLSEPYFINVKEELKL